MKKNFVLLAVVILLLVGTVNVYGQTMQTCTVCNGKGRTNACFMCKGSGRIYAMECSSCNGTGSTSYLNLCYNCNASGMVRSGTSSAPAQNNSPSSGGSGGSTNTATMVQNYQNMAKNVEMALANYRNAVSRGDSQSERDRLRNNVLSQQQRMKEYREDCNRKGAKIGADYYETVRP